MKKSIVAPKVNVNDNKLLIIGRSFLNVHIPSKEEPIALRSVTYMLVMNANTLVFYGSSGKCFKLRNLVSAQHTAEAIARAIEKGKSSMELFAKFFFDPKETYELPAIEEAFASLAEDDIYSTFKACVGLLKRERDEILRGTIPTRLQTNVFAFACAVLLTRPITCPLIDMDFWSKLISNEEDKGITEAV